MATLSLQLSDVKLGENINPGGVNNVSNQPSGMTEEMKEKRFGVSSEEMKNWAAYQRLGISQVDYEEGKSVASSNPSTASASPCKQERLTGYSFPQLNRAKALTVLGTDEEEVEESRSIRLGFVGDD